MELTFFEFIKYNNKERVLINIEDISSINEDKNYCIIYFKSTNQIQKISDNYDIIIDRLKQLKNK